MRQIAKISPLFMFPITVLLVHVVLSKIVDLYTVFPSLDIPVHYAGGLSIAYAATQVLFYLESERGTAPLNRAIFLILIVSLTATAAVFWEFAEFLGDRFLAINVQISLANTMQDQFMGILGGTTWALICFAKDRAGPPKPVALKR
jgi:hypothetical protein